MGRGDTARVIQWLEPGLGPECLDRRPYDPRGWGRQTCRRELAWLPRYLVTFAVDTDRADLGWELWICGLDGALLGGRPEPRAKGRRAELADPPTSAETLVVSPRLGLDEAEGRARSALARTAQVLRVASDVREASVSTWRAPAWVEIVVRSRRRAFGFRGRDAVTGQALGAVARQALLQRLVEVELG